eukprot:2941190-Rhodomonas_salina.2
MIMIMIMIMNMVMMMIVMMVVVMVMIVMMVMVIMKIMIMMRFEVWWSWWHATARTTSSLSRLVSPDDDDHDHDHGDAAAAAAATSDGYEDDDDGGGDDDDDDDGDDAVVFVGVPMPQCCTASLETVLSTVSLQPDVSAQYTSGSVCFQCVDCEIICVPSGAAHGARAARAAGAAGARAAEHAPLPVCRSLCLAVPHRAHTYAASVPHHAHTHTASIVHARVPNCLTTTVHRTTLSQYHSPQIQHTARA